MGAPHLSQAILRRLLHYDPKTGDFVWRQRADVGANWNTRYAGKKAGYVWHIGNVSYRSIRIFDWPFLAHRLAYLYVTGKWPKDGVDHKDLNGLNNSWENLRPATKSQNGANTRAHKRNKTGFKGVTQSPPGRFRATILLNGKQKWLGTFDSAEAAHEAYATAAIERSGEFARAK